MVARRVPAHAVAVILCVFVGTAPLSLAPPARSEQRMAAACGGCLVGSRLSWDRAFYVEGDVAHAAATVCLECGRGKVDGPYYVYLVPKGPAHGPHWVARHGRRVGVVEISSPSKRFSRVSARFEVPEVPLGDYAASICNESCAKSLGDLVGSVSLRIERTRLQGYIHGQMIEARTRIMRRIGIGEIRTKRRLLSQLRKTSAAVLDQASSARFSQAASVADLQTTVDLVLDEQRRPAPFPWTAAVLAFGLGTAAVGSAAGYRTVRARRRWDRDFRQWNEKESVSAQEPASTL